jgi:hypothetical protein
MTENIVKNKTAILLLTLFATAFGLTTSAMADVITFSGVGPGPASHPVNSPYQELNYSISAPHGLYYLGYGDPRYAGENNLFDSNYHDVTTLSTTNGKSFSIQSIDLALMWLGSWPEHEFTTFTGNLVGGGTVTQTFDVNDLRWPVFRLIWLKLIFSESDVAGYNATGQVTSERRRKPFQLARGAIDATPQIRDATEPGFNKICPNWFRSPIATWKIVLDMFSWDSEVGPMQLPFIRAEIERMRRQISRQQKDIQSLKRAGISTASAELLLARMRAAVDGLCDQRDRLVGEQRERLKNRESAWACDMARKFVWYDPKLDTSDFMAELYRVRRMCTRQVGRHNGESFDRVQAIQAAIDDYAELETGNREYFWDRPVGIGWCDIAHRQPDCRKNTFQ